MAIILNDNINLASNKPLDKRFGPYANIADALNDIPAFQRHQGLVVGIIENGSVIDYWFRDGIDDVDLVSKSIDYTSITNAPTIPGDIGDLTDTGNLLESFTFSIQSDDSAVFTVGNGTPLRLSGNLGITVEGDSSEGLVISGTDLSAVDQSILPADTEMYDLGSPSKRWRDLYLSGNSLSIGPARMDISTDDNGEHRLDITGTNSLSIDGVRIKAQNGRIDLPNGSTVNGAPLMTVIESNAFQLRISADDNISTAVISGADLQFIGSGGTTTRVDENGNLVIISPTVPQTLGELSDVKIDSNSLAIGKVLKYNGTNWVASNESGNPDAGGSGSGDSATLNGFSGTYYLNYNNLTNKPDPYVLPPATTTTLGGVIVGTNVNVNDAGRIDVPTGAGINTVTDIPNVIDVDGLENGDTLVYNSALSRWEVNTVDLSNSEMDGGFY